MKLLQLGFISAFLITTAFAQFTENPLDELKKQIATVLADANVPFTEEQDNDVALLMEEQRRATEEFFGIIMDFRNGPPQGADRDRALAGIQWMQEEFRRKLPGYLSADQNAVFERYESSRKAVGATVQVTAAEQPPRQLIQQIRVTNNAFSAETGNAGPGGPSGGGVRTDVIERGGSGAFHGNFSSSFQDEKFNARNPFASNKPSYYERNISAGINGPVIPNRLTLNFSINDRRTEDVGAVKAVTLSGPFTLGLSRPSFNRSYNTSSVLQLADAHSLNVSFNYSNNKSLNQGVGNFMLPERASNSSGNNYSLNLREISSLSSRAVHDLRFEWSHSFSETKPATNAVAITVLDAFNGGGAQNNSRSKANTYSFGNLFYFQGERLTLRSGLQGSYRQENSRSESNFLGEFTFSDLASYQAGAPLKYKVTKGDPEFDMDLFQIGFFVQNDIKVTNRFTFLVGARFDRQTITGNSTVDPRLGFAYAIGNSTVIRGGAGTFHSALNFNQIQSVIRLDGTRLYELQVDNPTSMEDPLQSGNTKVIPPSSRSTLEPGLKDDYYASAQISIEQTLPKNLFVSVTYDYNRGVYLTRVLNLNALDPVTGLKPFPNEGQINQTTGNGFGRHKNLRLTMRQRFSFFNVNATYQYFRGRNDEGPNRLPTNNYNVREDWGQVALNPSHRFTVGINSDLPLLGATLTTNINARSGTRYTITTGKDDNKDGTINDRPTGDLALQICGAVDEWNRCPKFGETGPGYFNVDFNLTKVVQLSRNEPGVRRTAGSGGAQMNVFANLNNAFNTTHPGTPSGVMTSPFFRRSFNASGERTIVVGMRFQF